MFQTSHHSSALLVLYFFVSFIFALPPNPNINATTATTGDRLTFAQRVSSGFAAIRRQRLAPHEATALEITAFPSSEPGARTSSDFEQVTIQAYDSPYEKIVKAVIRPTGWQITDRSLHVPPMFLNAWDWDTSRNILDVALGALGSRFSLHGPWTEVHIANPRFHPSTDWERNNEGVWVALMPLNGPQVWWLYSSEGNIEHKTPIPGYSPWPGEIGGGPDGFVGGTNGTEGGVQTS